jgi:hypothetical protein
MRNFGNWRGISPSTWSNIPEHGSRIMRYLDAHCRSWWPCSQRPRSAACRMVELRLRIPLRTWIPLVFILCCLSSGLCNKLVSRSEENFGCVWDTETSPVTHPRPELSRCATENKNTLKIAHFCRTVSLCSRKRETEFARNCSFFFFNTMKWGSEGLIHDLW